MDQKMEIKTYLTHKGIEFKDRGNEVEVKCLFSSCDDDSRPGERHLYFNSETGLYLCHKCGAKGNLVTLMKFLGDEPTKNAKYRIPRAARTAAQEAARCHKALPHRLREYLVEERGLTDATINEAMLGFGEFYGQWWLTIPITGSAGIASLKLRRLPWDDSGGPKYKSYPNHPAELYNGQEMLLSKTEEVIICEGELDAIMAKRRNLFTTVSGTAGASTFKAEWLQLFKHAKTVWLCLDNDSTGIEGALRIVEIFGRERPDVTLMQITLPIEVGEHGDLTDYFKLPDAQAADLFTRYAKHVAGPAPIDVSEFDEMSLGQLAGILNQTIKYDSENKCIVFLGMLTAYTEEDQLNIMLTGPSSSGKTYLATETAKYFPAEDVEEFAAVSPTGFRHRRPKIDTETGEGYVDCERKILIFLELPHPKLQENLRPLLSHDKKEIRYLVTEKEKSGGNTAKESVLRGYPATVFCSASMRMDEQEATRAILLSPEISADKLAMGIELAARKSGDPTLYKAGVSTDPQRRMLEHRIRAIKRLRIDSVIIPESLGVLERFRIITGRPRPRHQRDIAHLSSLIKAVAILNAWFRFDAANRVVANEQDVTEALQLWRKLSESQELGIPPYASQFYSTYILPAFREKNRIVAPGGNPYGVTRREITKKYFEIEGQMPNDDNLRKNILATLVAAGVITEDRDPNDGKQKLIYPKQADMTEEGASK